jgi:hypothetical protein
MLRDHYSERVGTVKELIAREGDLVAIDLSRLILVDRVAVNYATKCKGKSY